MTNKHEKFAESLRNIIRDEEKPRREIDQKRCDEDLDEDSLSLQEMLEAKFDELFGTADEDDD